MNKAWLHPNIDRDTGPRSEQVFEVGLRVLTSRDMDEVGFILTGQCSVTGTSVSIEPSNMATVGC